MYDVAFTQVAERDLENIYSYIAEHDSVERSNVVVSELTRVCASLAEFPERGNIPAELRALGIAEFREVHYKPYRLIYTVNDGRVVIYCILDGRRDMQSLLEQRLLR